MTDTAVSLLAVLGAACWLVAAPAAAQPETAQPDNATQEMQLTAAQVFALASEAEEAGDFAIAEAAYRALAMDPDITIRNEARFRLALMLADERKQYAAAAVLLRQILDEQPDVGRVRLELARMQAQLGNLREADRELRAASASGLPADVEQMVQFFRTAINANRPFGANIELALAPDSNINRATRSDTLSTVIGDFTLDEDAQAQSGIGLFARTNLWARLPVSARIDIAARASAGGNIYRESQFNDLTSALHLGPRFRLGRDLLSVSATTSWRWFGGSPFTFNYGVETSYTHPMGKTSQLSADVTVLRSEDRLNTLRDANIAIGSIGIDKSFSARWGGGVRLNGQRQDARDPGFSITAGGGSIYTFREFGSITVVASIGYQHLEADARLFLFPKRRIDERLDLLASATLRSLRVGRFAPLVRLRYERNWSSVGIFDFDRLGADVGITAAF
jgi:outer membrane protein